MEANDARRFGYQFKVYQGFIRSGQDLIHQAATRSRCLFAEGYCSPTEDHKLVLIYQRNIPKLPEIFKYMGNYQATRVGSLVTLPELGSGGSVSFETKESVTLDTGYILKMNSSVLGVKQLKNYNLSLKACSRTFGWGNCESIGENGVQDQEPGVSLM